MLTVLALSFILGTVYSFGTNSRRPLHPTRLYVGERNAQGLGDSSNSFMIKEFANYEQLQNIVQLASLPLPERPDGIVCVAKFTSTTREDCRATEAEYERLARKNPASVFLRCYKEYEGADLLVAQADVSAWPCFDIFYGGNRVARIDGPSYEDLQDVLNMYQLQKSQLDLFSEDADNERRLAWGDGKIPSAMETPRTSNRFIAGYDWNKDRGFFDDLGDQLQEDWDKAYGDWTPNIED